MYTSAVVVFDSNLAIFGINSDAKIFISKMPDDKSVSSQFNTFKWFVLQRIAGVGVFYIFDFGCRCFYFHGVTFYFGTGSKSVSIL